MVRTIVGTLVEVGRGRRPVEWVAGVLASRDRAAAGPTAPAHGLFLVRVETHCEVYSEGTGMSLEQLLSSIPPGSPDEALARQVNFDQLPAHVAIIMDGNGRWAAQRHLPRVEGHRAGIDSVRDVVETSARLGIGVLTLYAFSVENWKRPLTEINTLMTLLKRYLRLELGTLLKNNIRFEVIGRQDELSRDVRQELEIGVRKTTNNTGMVFNIALNYGGRSEIVDAAKRILLAGVNPDDLDERRFSEFLYTAGQPDPDLLIRTSGEMRVSNFLLWQIAYAEIWVTETLWPDFRRRHLLEAVVAYQKRDRRYGGIKARRRWALGVRSKRNRGATR